MCYCTCTCNIVIVDRVVFASDKASASDGWADLIHITNERKIMPPPLLCARLHNGERG